MKTAKPLIILALLGMSNIAFADWQRLPFTESVPVNLANKSIPGTKLSDSSGIGNAQALISGGAAEAAAIPTGKSEATIALLGQHVIDEVRFINDGAEGKVSVSASVDAKHWQAIGQNIFAAPDHDIVVHFPGASARYVRVFFEVAKGSAVRGFSIYGATTDKDYKLAEKSPESKSPESKNENSEQSGSSSGSGASLNLASGLGGARPIYAFPMPINTSEDDMKKNVFRFPKSNERFRVIIYDLGSPRKVKQFASAYSERPTRLEVFAFEQLPEKKDWRGKLTLDQSIFDTTKPVAMGEDARGVGHIKLVPEKPVTAQYVALRYEPNYNRHASVSENEESWSGQLAASFVPFSGIAQQLVLGEAGRYIVDASNVTSTPNSGGGESFSVDGLDISVTPASGGGWTVTANFNPSKTPSSSGSHGSTHDKADPAPTNTSSPFSALYGNNAAGGGIGANPFGIPAASPPTFKNLTTAALQTLLNAAQQQPATQQQSVSPATSN